MKKKFLYGIAVLAIAAIAAWNVSVNSQNSNNLSNLSLTNVEALAWPEWLDNWWNSKVYMCVNATCSRTYTLGPVAITYYGNYNNCISGDSYAHCWECESSCNAY